MAKSKPDTSSTDTLVDPVDPVDAVLADNPDLADELSDLTPGEKLIRLRQRGLVEGDVQ